MTGKVDMLLFSRSLSVMECKVVMGKNPNCFGSGSLMIRVLFSSVLNELLLTNYVALFCKGDDVKLRSRKAQDMGEFMTPFRGQGH